MEVGPLGRDAVRRNQSFEVECVFVFKLACYLESKSSTYKLSNEGDFVKTLSLLVQHMGF